ncbi:MAG: FAD-dependent oxidoreductase [Pseudoxanthomonas suwonensis]|nr:FAD-dependent oxidoreductase [Pseudoxanthomonas suwonensis]
MDLKSGYPYWAVSNGLPHAFPPLSRDLQCEVAVLGGGITGALIADELAVHGHDVVVLDARDIGWGSTAASTALLQYENDVHLVDMARRHGEDAAAAAYRASLEAVKQVAARATSLGDVDLRRMDSLYWASRRRDRGPLREEFEMRLRHGLPVQWLDADEVEARFGFRAPAAIVSADAAAIDPYRMAWRLLMQLERRGVPVHDRSAVERMVVGARHIDLHTDQGARVRARRVVIAAGYASQQFLRRRVARNRSSYAFVTDPLPLDQLGALAGTMLWETARPYLYMRTTGDGRLMVGGADDAVDIPARRDARVSAKCAQLQKRVGNLFPALPVAPVFCWGGTFAETADGLPWMGPSDELGPRVLFAMAYGGNGITFSMLGAGVLRARIERRRHPLASLLGFERER